MKVVLGLGNPGRRYQNTRHNVGIETVAELARRHGNPRPQRKFAAELVEIVLNNEKTLLLAPETYMNASGRSARAVVDFYDLSLDDLLVVCDDMNLGLGRLRWRRGGSAGGQKGLQDIINRLGSQDFPRLRIGIGRPPERMDPADYVLSRFRKDEREIIDEAIQRAAEGVETWVRSGIDEAMNRFNTPQPH